MEKENLELVTNALGKVMNDVNFADEYFKEDYIQHNPMVDSGREPFKQFFKGWTEAMPDLKWEPVLAPVTSGDQVWLYGTYKGTFKNDWMGMPANNKRVEFNAVDIFRVEDGKIAEHWDVMDLKTMFEQMKN